MAESSQAVLKSDLWMRRRLLSAFCAWVDSHVALLSVNQPASATAKESADSEKSASPANVIGNQTSASQAVTSGAGNSVPAKPEAQSAAHSNSPSSPLMQTVQSNTVNPKSHPSVGHYLEPAPTLYRSLREKMQQMVNDLNAINFLPAKYKDATDTLLSLCLKFEDISRKEISNQYLSPQDAHFLSAIDEVLDKMYSRLPATIHLENNTILSSNGRQISGANLCLGRPGLLFVMLHLGRGDTLSRGAVYTGYEVAGGSIQPKRWERSLDNGMVRPPTWTAGFEVMQGADTGATSRTPNGVR
jgi:hypothetical protein